MNTSNSRQSISVDILNTTTINNYTLYDLTIQIYINQLNSYEYLVSKRFSDFVNLKKRLIDIGYSENEIPLLPSRYTGFFKSTSAQIEERKEGLIKFTLQVLNHKKLRNDSNILLFYNIPKSVFMQMDMIDDSNNSSTKTKNEFNDNINYKDNQVSEITSAQQWMDTFRFSKSLLQDARTKTFNSGNIISAKKSLKIGESNLGLLRSYLTDGKDLGYGEILKRKEMVLSLSKEFNDLNKMITDMTFKEASSKPMSQEGSSSLFSTNMSNGTSSRRTFGKPTETEETKRYDNKDLFQLQKDKMQSQDQDLEALREIIIRQKQIGVAVNDELTIQNEILNGLGQHVDESTNKLNSAKSKVKKFL